MNLVCSKDGWVGDGSAVCSICRGALINPEAYRQTSNGAFQMLHIEITPLQLFAKKKLPYNRSLFFFLMMFLAKPLVC